MELSFDRISGIVGVILAIVLVVLPDAEDTA
jgi:tetrahydromethanopterin S-methyltransferase subunit F